MAIWVKTNKNELTHLIDNISCKSNVSVYLRIDLWPFSSLLYHWLILDTFYFVKRVAYLRCQEWTFEYTNQIVERKLIVRLINVHHKISQAFNFVIHLRFFIAIIIKYIICTYSVVRYDKARDMARIKIRSDENNIGW